MRRYLVVVGMLLARSAVAPAAVVAFLNATPVELQLTIQNAGISDEVVTLLPGTTKAVFVGRSPVLRVTLNGKPEAFTLDPYTPYLFVPGEKGEVVFSGVELDDKLPKPIDVPLTPVKWNPVRLPVAVFTDAGSPLVREERERTARERFEAAAKVIDDQIRVRFDVTEMGEWDADPKAASLAAAAGEFQREAMAKSARVFGFMSASIPGDEFAAPLTDTHALVRGGAPKSSSERVEVVTHQLGQWLGAVRSPDGGSVMRAKLGDGQAAKKDWVIQFDPLNLIVMHIWAEELAAGRGPKPTEFRPEARARLHVLYRSIAAIHTAVKSEDTQARDRAALFAGEADPILVTPMPEPAPVFTDDERSDDEKAIRAVVFAVTARAKQIAELPVSGQNARPKGDALTAEYVKAAAAVAVGLDEKRRARAFVLGLGIALDDSTILRDKPVIKKVSQAVETEAERKERIAVLGRPTIWGRRDLCQHYVVSAALTEVFGAEAAEFAGLSKELVDMKGTSGFSFADLAADLAGIELAKTVTKSPAVVAKFAEAFVPTDAVPDVAKLPEGLSEEAFEKRYGGTGDPRFRAEVDAIRKSVAKLALYRQ